MAKAKKQQKASNPADIAARRAERRDLESRGITVNVDPRTEEIRGAWRHDCFTLLLRNHPDEAASVRWLEQLIRDAAGENTKERRPDFIRASCEGAPGQNITQHMIEASRVLEVVEFNLRPWEARLLFELLRPDEALLTRWREVVKRVTAATTPQRQGERVVVACESLLWVRQNIDRLMRARQEVRAA